MVGHCLVLLADIVLVCEGLTAELKDRYEHGSSLQTTLIHTSWARTPIMAGKERWVESAGQKMIDPQLVVDKVAQAVLSGRSGGQIMIPSGFTATAISTMSAWPKWLFDVIFVASGGSKIFQNGEHWQGNALHGSLKGSRAWYVDYRIAWMA